MYILAPEMDIVAPKMYILKLKMYHSQKKRYKSRHWGCTFSKRKAFVHFRG